MEYMNSMKLMGRMAALPARLAMHLLACVRTSTVTDTGASTGFESTESMNFIYEIYECFAGLGIFP